MTMRPGSVELPLKWPIQVDGAERHALTVRRPTARDQIALAENADTPGAEARMLADLCEQTVEMILSLDFEDYWALKETYIGFLPSAMQSMLKDSLNS